MKYIEIALIMGAHGIRGDLRVDPYNPDSTLFAKGRILYLKQGQGFEPREISFVGGSKKGIRLHLSGIESRDEASALYRRKLYCPREEFPKTSPDEEYVIDLIGLEVVDRDSSESYGKLKDVLTTGAGDCYVVMKGERELLIPATKQCIYEVDRDAGIMRVCLPEGLLELYES